MQTLHRLLLLLFPLSACLMAVGVSGLDKWAELRAVGRAGAAGRKTLPPPPLYTDCRFWTDPHQHFEMLRMKHRPGRVSQAFFYWDNTRQVCVPCTRCQASGLRTLVACDFFTDAQCVTEEEWRRQKPKHPYWGGAGDDDEYYDDGEDSEEAVVVHEAKGPVKRGEKVFGEAKFATYGERKEDDSATRQVIRHKVNETLKKYGKRMQGGGAGAGRGDSGSPYGQPSFYANGPKEKKNSVVNKYEDQPIDDVVREFLNNNITGKVSVKDIRGRVRQRQRPKHPSRTTTGTDSKDTVPPSGTGVTEELLVWTTKRYYEDRTATGSSSTASTAEEEEETTSFQKEMPTTRRSFDDSELVRPDIFSPTKEEFHRNTRIFGGKKGHRRGPEAPQYEDGGEFGVEHDNLDDKEAGQKPGDLAFNQIVHDLMEDMNEVEESLEGKGGPFKKSSQKAPVLLEQILMIVSLVVLILLVLLAIVVVRNKYKASRFKLLDNADGVESYQSLSPFRRSESTTTRLTTSPGHSSAAGPGTLELGQAAPVRQQPPPQAAAAAAAVPEAVARSLKNINPANRNGTAAAAAAGREEGAAVYVDERGRTKLK